MTVVDWVDLFTRASYKEVIVESLRYCQQHKGLELYAWCLMPSQPAPDCRSPARAQPLDISARFQEAHQPRIAAPNSAGAREPTGVAAAPLRLPRGPDSSGARLQALAGWQPCCAVAHAAHGPAKARLPVPQPRDGPDSVRARALLVQLCRRLCWHTRPTGGGIPGLGPVARVLLLLARVCDACLPVSRL